VWGSSLSSMTNSSGWLFHEQDIVCAIHLHDLLPFALAKQHQADFPFPFFPSPFIPSLRIIFLVKDYKSQVRVPSSLFFSTTQENSRSFQLALFWRREIWDRVFRVFAWPPSCLRVFHLCFSVILFFSHIFSSRDVDRTWISPPFFCLNVAGFLFLPCCSS